MDSKFITQLNGRDFVQYGGLLDEAHKQGLKGIMVNIFGGITRCDEVAKGMIEATQTLNINVPVVVRLAGTAEEEGRKILEGSKFTPAVSMQDAAQKVVALAGLK